MTNAIASPTSVVQTRGRARACGADGAPKASEAPCCWWSLGAGIPALFTITKEARSGPLAGRRQDSTEILVGHAGNSVEHSVAL